MTKEKQYSKKIDFIISQLKFLRKYYNKQKSFDMIENELLNLKQFNSFLHNVISLKEQEIKRYEGYKYKYEKLLDKVNNPDKRKSIIRDNYGRDINKEFYFPFT